MFKTAAASADIDETRRSVSSSLGHRLQASAPERTAELQRLSQSVCDLAKGLFGLPMVMVKLYDGPILKLAGACGFPSGTEFDDFSFCERRLVPGEGLLVTDATRDARFFLDSPVRNTPRLRFYVDMPLVTDGVLLGVLALCEDVPRHDFSEYRLGLLRQYANLSATLLGLAQTAAQRNDIVSELRSRQARMDFATDLTGIGYWKIDLKTRQVTWSQGLFALYGLDPRTYEPTVATQLDIFETADREEVISHFQRAVNEGVDFDFNLRVFSQKDRSPRMLRTKGGVERDGSGSPVRLCAVVQDVSAEIIRPAPALRETSPSQGMTRQVELAKVTPLESPQQASSDLTSESSTHASRSTSRNTSRSTFRNATLGADLNPNGVAPAGRSDMNVAKSAFLSHIADGLKSPLNDILTYARLLNDPGQARRATAEYSEGLLESASRLETLLRETFEPNVSETSHLSASTTLPDEMFNGLSDGNYEAFPEAFVETSHDTKSRSWGEEGSEDTIDLISLIKDVVDSFSVQASSHQTRLHDHFVDFATPYARCDAMRLTQVLQNLVSNACKFTRGGSVTVTASQISIAAGQNFEPDMRLHISVRDSGIGMSDEQVRNLLSGSGQGQGQDPKQSQDQDPVQDQRHDFNQKRSHSSLTGLGLSISKTIVEYLGGHMGVLSRPGEGSNFWFEIPVAWVEAQARTDQARTDHAPARVSASRRPLHNLPPDPLRPDPRSLDVEGPETSRRVISQTVGNEPVVKRHTRSKPVDEDRINREYLKALLSDMKLNFH